MPDQGPVARSRDNEPRSWTVSDLQWVVDGYAIALASLMLGGGTIGDLYGHKRVVLTGLALFGAASLACGLAPSSGALVGCRVLQGVGAALMLPGTLAVITNAYPREEKRARAIGLWAAIGSVALPAGPPALLVWGVGLAFLTPAVVAAAVGALPGERAGLASAVNNTARQPSGAVGIGAFGALAGQPGSQGFMRGFHLAAAIAAGLFVCAAVVTARFIPSAG